MRRMLIAVTACVLVLAACGGDEAEEPAAEEPAAETGQGAEEETPATLQVADSELGEIIVDVDGNTLYMFVPDQEANGEPTCYDDCADAWPAVEAVDDPTVGEGLDQSTVATVERTDGSTQLTYNDLPLYYFSGDEAAGDTNGQGLNDVWWVLSPDGEPIRGDQGANQDPYRTG